MSASISSSDRQHPIVPYDPLRCFQCGQKITDAWKFKHVRARRAGAYIEAKAQCLCGAEFSGLIHLTDLRPDTADRAPGMQII